MYWQNLTSPKLERMDRRTPVVLPVAAIEQHGPHLPLATDRMIGEYFCQRLHEELGERVLILPTVAVGCSEHHMEFAGSLTLTHETFARQVEEILECAVRHGFHNLVLLNSHGGNQGIGQVIVERFGAAHRNGRIVLATWWRIAPEKLIELNESGAGGVGHAGEFETSLMELIAPELIDHSAIDSRANRPTYSWAEGDLLRSPKAAFYRTMKEMTANGAQGEPTAAHREKGEAIAAIVMDALKQIVLDLQSE